MVLFCSFSDTLFSQHYTIILLRQEQDISEKDIIILIAPFMKKQSIYTIVSQLSKCLKFMTFREGCFKTGSSMQVLN